MMRTTHIAPSISLLSEVARQADLRITRAQGCAISWRIWGCGQPLVLLHGNGGSWSHWIRNIPFLMRSYRVFAADIPGFGDSDMPPQPYTADSIAALLREGLNELGLAATPVLLVGFSFGCSIAGALAKQLGQNAAMLVVVSAGHLRVRKNSIPPFVSWRKLSDPSERQAAHRHNLEAMMISRPERVDDLAILIQSENTAKMRLEGAKVTVSHPLRDDLERVCCPFVGIWGERDSTIGPFMQERIDLFHELGRAGHAHTIDDAGHWHPYEAADAFNRRLASVLAQTNS